MNQNFEMCMLIHTNWLHYMIIITESPLTKLMSMNELRMVTRRESIVIHFDLQVIFE